MLEGELELSFKREGRVVWIMNRGKTIGYFDAPPNGGNPSMRLLQMDTNFINLVKLVEAIKEMMHN